MEGLMLKLKLHETGLILRCAGKAGNPFQTTHRYADDTTLMAESEEELKSILTWVGKIPWRRA